MSDVKDQEDLRVEKLVSGDRPSIYALGMIGAHAIAQTGVAVFQVDVMGRVYLTPMSSVQILAKPRVEDAELHELPQEVALAVLVKQGDDDDSIVEYLKRRAAVRGDE